MKTHVLILALLFEVSAKAEPVCENLNSFLTVRKSNTLPTPLARVRRSDGLLGCVKNCTYLNACRSYAFSSTADKCVLLDEYKRPIMTKEHLQNATVSASAKGSATNGSPKGRCQNSYQYLLISKTCLKIHENATSWMEAMDVCRSETGALVIIQNAKKQQAIKHLLKRNNIKEIWIGARDINETDTYTWYDGSPMNYTAWGKFVVMKEPTHRSGSTEENCVELNFLYRYNWNDRPCDLKISFVCETKSLQ